MKNRIFIRLESCIMNMAVWHVFPYEKSKMLSHMQMLSVPALITKISIHKGQSGLIWYNALMHMHVYEWMKPAQRTEHFCMRLSNVFRSISDYVWRFFLSFLLQGKQWSLIQKRTPVSVIANANVIESTEASKHIKRNVETWD